MHKSLFVNSKFYIIEKYIYICPLFLHDLNPLIEILKSIPTNLDNSRKDFYSFFIDFKIMNVFMKSYANHTISKLLTLTRIYLKHQKTKMAHTGKNHYNYYII